MIKEEDDKKLCASDMKSNWLLNTGLEEDVEFYKIPEDWNPPKRKTGQHKFKKVDNPGKWLHFCFHANEKINLLFFILTTNIHLCFLLIIA